MKKISIILITQLLLFCYGGVFAETRGLSATDWFKKGYAYHEAKKYQDAVNAYTRAIDLDLKYTKAYYNRGHAYLQQAFSDYKVAARLGLKQAQVYLREKGIDW